MQATPHAFLDFGTHGESRHRLEISGIVVTETVHRPRSEVEFHAHARAGLNLVLAGRYGEEIGGEFELHPPTTLIAKPAGEPHANRFDALGARCLLIEFEAELVDRSREMGRPLDRSSTWPAGCLAVSAVRAVHALRAGDPPPIAIEETAYALLRGIAGRRRAATERTRPAWLANVRDRIHAAAPARLRLAELATEAQVHPAHLSETFRRAFGTTISRYVERLRLERAVRDLAATDDPVGRIAIRSGFYDHANLTRAFRRATGTTPSAFRRAIRS
jgi:AraC family transcriptional regulator